MSKVLISDSIDKIASKILKSNNIDVDTITDLSSDKLKEIISKYDGVIKSKRDRKYDCKGRSERTSKDVGEIEMEVKMEVG